MKIGIVEDNVIIAMAIANDLKAMGYEITATAGSYSQALEMIEQEKPDILLVDILLAGKKDGIDLAFKVNIQYKLPIIFMTACSDASFVLRAKEVAPAGYLIKPFERTDLYASIETVLENSGYKCVA